MTISDSIRWQLRICKGKLWEGYLLYLKLLCSVLPNRTFIISIKHGKTILESSQAQ